MKNFVLFSKENVAFLYTEIISVLYIFYIFYLNSYFKHMDALSLLQNI